MTSSERLPLEHIRVADLTQAWAGAYASQLLADLGAEMIKVEARGRPDPWRGGYGASRGLAVYPKDGAGADPYNRSYLFNSVNRNKRGVTLDLSDARGRELFLELVRRADVVMENYTPRVLGNLGLDYARLCQERPGLILLSMPAYGLSGRYSQFPGIGGSVEPMSGNSWLLGEPGGEPQTSGVMYPDAVAGINGALAVLAALVHRGRTGEGRHVEVSQQESMTAMLGPFFARGDLGTLDRQGNRDATMVPHGVYPVSTTDGTPAWVAIACETDEQWQALCRAAATGWESDRRFATLIARLTHRDELDRAVGSWTAGRDGASLEQALVDAGVPAALVRSVAEAAECKQMTGRGYWAEVEHSHVAGTHRVPGVAPRLSATPGAVRTPPPLLGEHSRDVLTGILGVSEEEYRDLVARGITGVGPPDGEG